MAVDDVPRLIANARMYSVTPDVADAWRSLLSAVIARTSLVIDVIDHPPPAPLDALWSRDDLGAVFMCGLPFSRARPQPVLLVAPVPAPLEFGGEARYWSELVVLSGSPHRTVADTFGGRLALTVPGSQSGFVAALGHFQAMMEASAPGGHAAAEPLFAEIIAPTITPEGALLAVIRGEADIAPIDAYAFRLLRVHRPDLTSQVRLVGRTAPTPIPPLVASADAESGHPALLATAFLEAHQDPALEPVMNRLLLRRFVRPAVADYDVLSEKYVTTVGFWAAHRLAARIHPAFAL